ncbi:MAG: TonB-dependent receptor [Bacteroidales bacterium]|nr:TonB-dependent receptor [Bacteroidales bacterium]
MKRNFLFLFTLAGFLFTATLSLGAKRTTIYKIADKDTIINASDSSVILSEISVISSRVPIVWHKQARMITTIGKREITSAPAQSVNDLLKYSASVDVRQRGAIGAQTDVGIRGGNSEQAALLLNGINISDPQTSHNSFDLPVSLLQVDGIDILEGPAGKITGASSLMGAINVRTSIAEENKFFFNIEGGSFGYLSSGLRFDIAKGKRGALPVKNSISVSYTRSDGYARSESGHLNMDYKTLKSFYQGEYSDDDVQVNWYAGLSTKDYGSNRFWAAKYDNQFEHTFKSFMAVKGHNKKGVLTISPSLYWNHGTDRFELFRGEPDKYPFNYHKTNVYGVNLNNWFNWFAGTTAFGGEIRNDEIVSGNLGEPLTHPKHIKGTNRNYEYGLNRTNTSFFLEHNLIKEKFTVSAAILAIKNSWAEMDMKVYPSADLSVALLKNENNLLRLFCSYNSSLRMPSVTELYYSVGGHKADKHLKPEEAKALELGLKYLSNKTSASLSLFSNRMTDLIDWIRNTSEGEEAPWQSVNFGKVHSRGLLAQTSFTPDWGWNSFRIKSLNASYSYINQTKNKAENIQSKYVLEYLKHKFVASAEIQLFDNLNLNIHYRFQDRVGTYTDVEGKVVSFKPYGIFDTRLTYNFKNFRFFVEGNNITGVKYNDFGMIPEPGFWFMAGLNLSINL